MPAEHGPGERAQAGEKGVRSESEHGPGQQISRNEHDDRPVAGVGGVHPRLTRA